MDDALMTLSLTAAAAGVLVFGGLALRATLTRHRSARKLDTALSNMRTTAANPTTTSTTPAVPPVAKASPHGAREAKQIQQQIAKVGQRWIDTGLGRRIVTDEDRKLLEECGYYGEHARTVFGGTRIVLPPLLAVVGVLNASSLLFLFVWGFVGFALGYLGPKWLLGRRKENRRRRVDDELPVMVDMLRLLQGVGLSIDQSLQVIANEFQSMLPVLAGEFGRANQQFASGRPREQTLLRIARLFDNEDLKGLITLLTQVDRFGGAVQEPLRQFGGRLQENRRARLKEQVGKLTVKMTMIMVITLLPALLIIAAGPGFMSVMRSLQQTGGH
ncbi:type II secretion system F family protein [Ralstonia insidiosa]|jgi:tight adherence protein C|uniref:type II secretion system F family protein n=1 Tax=Ralstonia TaxID=48736 RepID=UPI0006648D4C|nr:type II secretion system F family protein [Ralstonia insidiosa]KMW44378.1 pilus assembly protein TadC [Ralstonia sp. MD27]MBX3771565.1 type II secretion system F family protein [Ralstonia pickettii]NOZ16767.1 type II secretion system F family protein [Betaproteobacteria bacterium]MBA9858541.1 type II secretion system F family protein [Ralstonia insidiosa]MBA9871802.1 type II secretion system F family protein [Ralstonia insidiosa]